MAMTRDELAREVASYGHGRVPRALRRRQALVEGRALFVERGFQGASMDELARRMGVTKPVIYGVVGSKERLFHDVMTEVNDELTEVLAGAVAAGEDVGTRLRASILAFLRYVETHRADWSSLMSSVASSGPASDAFLALRRSQVLVVAGLVRSIAGPTVPASTAEVLAAAINGAVETVGFWWERHPELGAEEVADLLAGLLGPGLRALVDAPDTGKAGSPR